VESFLVFCFFAILKKVRGTLLLEEVIWEESQILLITCHYTYPGVVIVNGPGRRSSECDGRSDARERMSVREQCEEQPNWSCLLWRRKLLGQNDNAPAVEVRT